MREEYEIQLKSSAGQFVEFLESTVWTDIHDELNVWLEGVRDGLEDVEATERELFRNQGRADAVRHMLSLPETIRDQLLEEQRTRQEKEEDEPKTDEMEDLL